MSQEHSQVGVAPIFPVTDLDQALHHYAQLGFQVAAHDDGTYGFAGRAGIMLHLSVVADHDPLRTAAAAYLYVPDADALAAEWAPVDRTGPAVDTDYGLREGWHIDPDGNLLRFGSPLASGG
jgi:hypothetical protein